MENGPEGNDLRERAKKRLEGKRPVRTRSPDDNAKLVEELSIHQEQLNIQNEELLRIQAELEVSRSRYFRLYDLAPVGYITLTSDLMIMEANLATSTLLGVDRKDLIDKGLSSFVSPRSHESLYLHYRRVAQGKDRQVHTFSIQRKGGKNIQVRFESNLVEGESDTGFRSILTDVTELKKAEDALMESEARYRSLFKDNNAPMLLIDPSTGNIVDANQQACDFYGYEYENLRNMKIFDINTLNPEKVDSEMGKSLSREKGHFNFRHQLANGEVHDVEVYSGPIYIEGRPLLYSIIHDVTDRMRIEEELRKRTKELARSNAELQQFAYVASHDLQEPLRMVVGFLSLFERKYTKDLHPKAQEYIKSAVEGGTRMRELVDDLLEYSIPNVINSCE